MGVMKRIGVSNYINLKKANIIKYCEFKDIKYELIIRKKIKNINIPLELDFKNDSEVLFFKKFGFYMVDNYYINLENLVYLNILEKNEQSVHVEFIFTNMTFDAVIDNNKFNYWQNHYL